MPRAVKSGLLQEAAHWFDSSAGGIGSVRATAVRAFEETREELLSGGGSGASMAEALQWLFLERGMYADGAYFANIVLRECCLKWDLAPARDVVRHVLPSLQELQAVVPSSAVHELMHWVFYLEVLAAVEAWQEHWETKSEGLGEPHWTEALSLKAKHAIDQIRRLAVQSDELGAGWLVIEQVPPSDADGERLEALVEIAPGVSDGAAPLGAFPQGVAALAGTLQALGEAAEVATELQSAAGPAGTMRAMIALSGVSPEAVVGVLWRVLKGTAATSPRVSLVGLESTSSDAARRLCRACLLPRLILLCLEIEVSVLESCVAGRGAAQRLEASAELAECVADRRQGLDALFSRAEVREVLEWERQAAILTMAGTELASIAYG
eukprot:scaffold1853_cov367-Prasinococcus_capsulatus_cf.AAC.4